MQEAGALLQIRLAALCGWGEVAEEELPGPSATLILTGPRQEG